MSKRDYVMAVLIPLAAWILFDWMIGRGPSYALYGFVDHLFFGAAVAFSCWARTPRTAKGGAS